MPLDALSLAPVFPRLQSKMLASRRTDWAGILQASNNIGGLRICSPSTGHNLGLVVSAALGDRGQRHDLKTLLAKHNLWVEYLESIVGTLFLDPTVCSSCILIWIWLKKNYGCAMRCLQYPC
jgi:hypothetical protein